MLSALGGGFNDIVRSFLGEPDSFVLGWGRNTEGQVGEGAKADHIVPIGLSVFKDIVVLGIACGEKHTVLIAARQRLCNRRDVWYVAPS
jgi:hypothetical protein